MYALKRAMKDKNGNEIKSGKNGGSNEVVADNGPVTPNNMVPFTGVNTSNRTKDKRHRSLDAQMLSLIKTFRNLIKSYRRDVRIFSWTCCF